MNPITFIADLESVGQRLDVFLCANLTDVSRSTAQKWIDEHCVLVEGHSQKPSYRIRAGERITISPPDPLPAQPSAQEIPLAVLYDEQDIIVLNTAAGLVVHPAPGNPDGTLVNALLHHCTDLSGIGGAIRPGIVHRLDRGTSGVMVVTKNDRTHKDLANQFLMHTTQKIYLAFVGRGPNAADLAATGTIDTLYGRHPVHRKRFSSRVERGKPAKTEYEIKKRFHGSDWSALLIEARPITGRTHQIRVHLADQGYPILGDSLYGGRSARFFPESILPPRTALHAKSISFKHPGTGKKVFFQAPLPDDLTDLEKELNEHMR